MAKRPADTQLENPKNGNSAQSEVPGLLPQSVATKASLAQLAKRKIATVRRHGAAGQRTGSPTPAPAALATNSMNFQQNGGAESITGNVQQNGGAANIVSGGLFGQQNFQPPSSGFNFAAGESFNFQAKTGTTQPMFGGSENNSGRPVGLIYEGNMFQVKSGVPASPKPAKWDSVQDQDPTKRPNPNFKDEKTATWADSSPYLSKTPAIDAVTGTTAADARRAEEEEARKAKSAAGGIFGQQPATSQSSSSTSMSIFGQAQPASSTSTSTFQFGANTPSTSSAPNFSKTTFTNFGGPPPSDGKSQSTTSGPSTEAQKPLFDVDSQPSTNPFSSNNNTSTTAASQPFTWPAQQQTSSAPTSNLFGSVNAQSSSAPSSSNLFGSVNAKSSSAPSSSNLFGSFNANSASSQKPSGQQQTSFGPTSNLFGTVNMQSPSTSSSTNMFGGFNANPPASQPSAGIFGGSPSNTAAPTNFFNFAPQASASSHNAQMEDSDAMMPDNMQAGQQQQQQQEQEQQQGIFSLGQQRPPVYPFAQQQSTEQDLQQSQPSEERRPHDPYPQQQSIEQAPQQSQPASTGNLFNFGQNATPRGSSAPPQTTNIFGTPGQNSQLSEQQSLFAASAAKMESQNPGAQQQQQQLQEKQQPKSTFPFPGENPNPLFGGALNAKPQSGQPSLFSSGTPKESRSSSAEATLKAATPSNIFGSLNNGITQPTSQQATGVSSSEDQDSPSKAGNIFGRASTSTSTPAAEPKSANNMFAPKQSMTNGSTTAKLSSLKATKLSSAVLESIKTQCITLIPPKIPEGFTEQQEQQFVLGYRVRCLEKGLKVYISHVLGDEADLSLAAQYYEIARSTIFSIAGTKRKSDDADIDSGSSQQHKRQNMNGPITNGVGSKPPLFGFPTAEKRKADEERGGSPKKSKAGDVSYPQLSETSQTSNSQTSRLFANLTGATQNSANAQPASTPAKSNNASSIFSTTPAGPPPSAQNMFGSVAKSANTGQKNNASQSQEPNSSRSVSAEPPKFAAPAAETSFLSQFGQKAQLSEAEEKAKRKAADYDSEGETEAEWEQRDAEEQAEKKKALAAAAALKVPSFGSANSSRSASPAFSLGETGSAENYLSQFNKKAQMTEAEEKAKRKAEDWDEDAETEEAWEKRDAEEQRKKKAKLLEQAKAGGFKPKASGASPALSATSGGSIFTQHTDALSASSTPNVFEHSSQAGSDAGGSKTGDADDEDEDEEGGEGEDQDEYERYKGKYNRHPDEGEGDQYDDEEEDEEGEGDEEGHEDGDGDGEDAEDGAEPPPTTTGRSLFDRIERDANGNPKKDTSGFTSSNAPSNGAAKGGSSTSFFTPLNASSNGAANSGPSTNPFARASGPTSSAGLFTPQAAKTSSNPFGFTNPSESRISPSPTGDHTWKPETPIKFGGSSTAPTVSITSPSPTKPAEKPLGGLFGIPKTTAAAPASTASPFVNPFAHLSSANSVASSPGASFGFNFGSPATSKAPSTTDSLAPVSVLASVTTSRATTPGMTTGEESTGEDGAAASDEPQLDLANTNAGEEEEMVLFEVKSKALEFASPAPELENSPKEWLTRGVGMLRLLKHMSTGKTRMVLRAGPTGKVVLNCGLIKGAKYENATKKSVTCLAVGPNKKLGKWTLQVGKEEDATKLAELLEKEKVY